MTTGSIDTAALKSRVDLVALVERDTTLRRIASTAGGEFAGPCPKCGGRDRLHVQAAGRWMCRTCHSEWSDAIGYVMWRDGVGFREAVAMLDGGTVPARTAPRPTPATKPKMQPATWRQAALQLVEDAENELWNTGRGVRAREYLMQRRGLTEETIALFRLGLTPFTEQEQFIPGLGRVTRGITIPRFLPGEDEPRMVNIRRGHRPAGEEKYKAVPGSQVVAFGLDTIGERDVAMLVEGEFDCMLVEQKAGDLVGTFTMGGATTGIDAASLPYLLGLRSILVAYDDDDAGRDGAAKMVATSQRMVRCLSIPGHNDFTELHLAGGGVRAFVQYHLARLAYQREAKS